MLRRLFDALYEKLLSRLGLALLVLALLINFGALIAVDRGVTRLDETRALAEHSRSVMTKLLGVQSMLNESDSAQRGFLYTGREEYLSPRKQHAASIVADLVELHQLVADNASQQAAIDEVRVLAATRIARQDKTIALYKAGQTQAAHAIVMDGEGIKLADEIDAVILRFIDTEEHLRLARIDHSAGIQLAIRWGFVAVLFINALMILALAVTIARGMARERAGEDRHDLREAESAAEAVRHDKREAISAAAAVASAAELRALSGHLLRVQEDERRTISRDLHDELGGTLSAIKMDILMGRDAAAKRDDGKSVARLQRALAATDTAVHFIRRLIETLRPSLLDNLGFEAALRAMADQFCDRCGVQCTIVLPEDDGDGNGEGKLGLTAAQSTALYRVCQEALTNVMKYAKAKRVTITLTRDAGQWKLLFTDDGIGLVAGKQFRSASHGLLGMRERIVALGGTFDIRGEAGKGTTLTATFPEANTEPAAP